MANETEKVLKLSHLATYDGLIKEWTGDQLDKFNLVELDTPSEGAAASYQLQFDGVAVGDTIDVADFKDYFVRNLTVETCETDDEPKAGFVVGDKYFDFTINTADDSGTAKHVYLKVTDAFAPYTQGAGITITGQTIAARIGDGLQTNASTDATEVKVGDGIEIDGTTKAVQAKVGDGLAVNTTSKAVEASVGTGLEINVTSKAIDLVAQSTDAGAPAIGGVTTADYTAFKGALDTITAPTETAPTAAATKNETIVTNTHTFTTADVDNTAGSFTVTEYYATYGDATPTVTGASPAAAKSGLMSGTDKDALDRLVALFPDGVEFATDGDIEALFD